MDQARTSCVQKTRPHRSRPGQHALLASGPSCPAGLVTPPPDRNSHPARERGPPAPMGFVAGVVDALGRVTERHPSRPDPSLAPAYLALTSIRVVLSGCAGSAHHAHLQGTQGTGRNPHARTCDF